MKKMKNIKYSWNLSDKNNEMEKSILLGIVNIMENMHNDFK